MQRDIISSYALAHIKKTEEFNVEKYQKNLLNDPCNLRR